MGVPKFYRWISERYPCLSEIVKEHQVPQFDNLYLDMNGIIHACSHPNDDDPHFRISEEDIFKDIFRYIEVLFHIIRPRKTFFMAVDGVAPRAKMNQQRGRRFRSAKDAEENIKLALLKGETLPTEKRFDSNCITPGTNFMEKLQTQLEYFVQSKVTHDKLWQGINIYLSGHQTPGEGEHKITEFIRNERTLPDYDPNTRHCLYGLDADLMMLALCSHEPHFALLREEVKFTRRKSTKTKRAEETTFHLLHISLMREYIDHEFEALKRKDTLSFPYDLESIIDDWVFMGFLVGNDFIPHLPYFHIADNALPILYQTYIEVLPKLDGYINEGGFLNLRRLQVYLDALTSFDLDKFEEDYEDYKWLAAHTQKTDEEIDGGPAEIFVHDIRAVPKSGEKSIQIVKDLAIQQGTYSLSDAESDEEGISDEQDHFLRAFKSHKKDYYSRKFKVTPSDEQVQCIAFEYILGIQWICHYYYNGVQSWGWYYPYHYSPFVSDLQKVAEMKLKYKMNKPFLPFQQLLAVLPAASKDCIPEAFWNLMDEENSDIGDFYPVEFSTDLNGKKQDWEAVVLIPFIDESRLLEAMEPCVAKLTKEERNRNQHGPCQLYTYDHNAPHYLKSSLPHLFPDTEFCYARRKNIPLNSWVKKNIKSLEKGLLPGCDLSVYYQGFPTLYHLPHKVYCKKQGVRVFDRPSRNENMILQVLEIEEDATDASSEMKSYSAAMLRGETAEEVAQRLLGKSVYVNWPHMEEAKVVSITDGTTQFTLQEQVTGSHGSKLELNRKELSDTEIGRFEGDLHDLYERCLNKRGIDVGDTDIVVYAQRLLGRKYVCGKRGEITLEKQWSTVPQAHAIQTVLKDISVKGPTFEKLKSLHELFPKDAEVFNLGIPNYGCMGKVLKIKDGNALVKFSIVKEVDLQEAMRGKNAHTSFYPGFRAAESSGISPYLLSRITGSIYVYFPAQQKWNVGLNLKFTKESSGIAGYTKRQDNTWLYSNALVDVIKQYQQKYPNVLQQLQHGLSNGSEAQLKAENIFGKDQTAGKLTEFTNWLKSLPCQNGRKVHENSNVLEKSVITAVNDVIAQSDRKKIELVLPIRPHFLYRPLAQQGMLIPDKHAQHRLLDRVINVMIGYTVPLGFRGTIVGIHNQGASENEVTYDVLFDDEFLGGVSLSGQCPHSRGYKMPACAIINLSHGERLANRNANRPVAVVRPHHQQQNKTWPSNSYSPTNTQTNVARPRFIQSPHSAFSPTKRNTVQRHSPGAVTLLQRPNQNSPQRSRNFQREMTLSSTQPQDVRQPKNVKQGNSNTFYSYPLPQPNNLTAFASNSGTSVMSVPAKTRGKDIFTLSEAARSLPYFSSKNSNEPTEPTEKPTSSKIPVTSSSVKVYHQSVSTTSKPKQLAIKTDIPRRSKDSSSETALPRKNVDTASDQDGKAEDKQQEKFLSVMLKNALKIPLKSAPASSNTIYQTTTTVAYSSTTASSISNDRDRLNKLLATLRPPTVAPVVPQPGYANKPFSLQEFLASNRNVPPPPQWAPPVFPPHPALLPPHIFQLPPPPPPPPQPFGGHVVFSPNMRNPLATETRSTSAILKEGTDKLAEILHLGSEEESLKKDIDTTVSTDQSTRLLPTKETNESPLVSEDENESKVSDEEETSIPDDETDQKVSDCHVAKLLDWCKSHGLYPPVYTYCDAEQYKGKLLCTVRLWNGLSFQSSAQFSRDEAMEDAASLALPHLENEAHVATVSSSPKQNAYNTPHVQQGVLLSYPSYCVKDFTSPSHNLQYTHQDGKVIAPRPYVVPPNPFVVPAPAQPYPNVHPAMVNNFMQMAPPVLNQPYPVSYPQRYYSIPGAGVYTTPFIPPVLPPYAFTTAALPNPIYYQTSTVTQNSENFAANSNSRLSATTNPFIPSQVKYSRSSDSATTSGCLSISRFETTGSPNYVLSDTPPTSVRSVSAATVNTSVQGPKTSKPKPKLAISFVKPSD